MRSIETATTHFTVTDGGILVGRAINLETPRTAQNTVDAFDRLDNLLGGRRLPGLWDPRTVDRFPPQAWRAMISRLEGSLLALAILADDETERAMGSFPATIDALMVPVRVFRDESEAMKWLQQFVDPDSSTGN
jgi:hypothetical protein